MSSHQPCNRSVKLPAYRRKKRARYYPHRIVTGGCSMTRGLLPRIPDSLPSHRASRRDNQSVSRSHPTSPSVTGMIQAIVPCTSIRMSLGRCCSRKHPNQGCPKENTPVEHPTPRSKPRSRTRTPR
ncbi:hypothetical protein GW17_00041862 [Ensete ventricosum]|nr:hypothetical protein GW17_00041862 [Ensete ventricosum]